MPNFSSTLRVAIKPKDQERSFMAAKLVILHYKDYCLNKS